MTSRMNEHTMKTTSSWLLLP